MPKSLSLITLAAFLGSGCAAPVPPARTLADAGAVPPARPSTAALRQVDGACASLSEVDFGRIPPMPDWRQFDELHAVARKGTSFPAADGASGAIKLMIPGGWVSTPYGISVFAARQRSGQWLLSHVQFLRLRPPPQPPGTPQLREPEPRIVRTGVLVPQAAERLEAALASECLKREPSYSPSTLPRKGGGDLHCPPDGGENIALEITQRGASRRYLRECGLTWATGTIVTALRNPENLLPL